MRRRDGKVDAVGTTLASKAVEKRIEAMSIALYQLRLYWDGHQGAMRNGKDTRILVEPPLLRGAANAAELEEIDYAPEVDVAQVREHDGDWRHMTADEVAAAEALLVSLAVQQSDEWITERAA